METVIAFTALAIGAVCAWLFYRSQLVTTLHMIGTVFAVSFVVSFYLLSALAGWIGGAVGGVFSFLGGVLGVVIKIAIGLVVLVVVLGVIGVILDKVKAGKTPGDQEETPSGEDEE